MTEEQISLPPLPKKETGVSMKKSHLIFNVVSLALAGSLALILLILITHPKCIAGGSSTLIYPLISSLIMGIGSIINLRKKCLGKAQTIAIIIGSILEPLFLPLAIWGMILLWLKNKDAEPTPPPIPFALIPDTIPFYRKGWFAISSYLIFAPLLFVILVTGPIYYNKNGRLVEQSKFERVLFIILTGGTAIYISFAIIALMAHVAKNGIH